VPKPSAIIAEDEAVLRKALRTELSRLWPELNICALAKDGVEALAQFERHRPSIIFLDIEMPGLSGLEVARQLSGRCQIVFTTAFDNYAIAAFEQGAVDYVLKPYDSKRLTIALNRVRERLSEPVLPIDTLLRDLIAAARPPSYLHWIKALNGASVELVLVEDVCFFQASAKYTGVYTTAAETLIRTPIKSLKPQLDPDRFWQISRSTIVRADGIARVAHGFDGTMQLLLKGRPERLVVSESYRAMFRHM
jgi:DNA-binding LytR/AlgR family response regulator